MNKIYFLYAIIGLISLISCDNDSTEYPIEYISHSIVDNSIKVYTKDGEISSDPIGKDFIERHKADLTQVDIKSHEGKMKATYTSSATVEIDFENDTGKREVHQEADLIYWEDQEISIRPYSYGFDHQNFLSHKPLYYIESDLPASTGLSKNTQLKHCYYLKSSHGKLNFPLLEFLHKHSEGYYYFYGNNEFNTAAKSDLTATDTIIVQQNWLEFY